MSKNILFLGSYLGKCGWSNAAKNYLRALRLTGHNIAARPIFMSDVRDDISDEFLDLQKTSFDNYDMVIQNVLPNLSTYSGRLGRNICLCFVETNHLEATRWPRFLNLLDETWVSSSIDAKYLKESGHIKPINKLAIPVNLAKYQKDYKKLPKDSDFTFYFVGEYTERKNVRSLLVAYLTEFKKRENVKLLIKTNRHGVEDNFREDVEQYLEYIKNRLSLHILHSDYPRVEFITDYIKEEELNSIHVSSDCFVMPSHGESFCIPAIDALGFGKSVITTDNIGLADYITKKNGWKVKSEEDIVISDIKPLPFLYTGRETWRNINILDLRRCMREAFTKNKKPVDCMKSIANLSYQSVAEQMNTII